MNLMNTNAGLWIDHREAVIVLVSDQTVETKTIASQVEKQAGRLAGVRSTTPYEPQLVLADDSHEREFMGHLQRYFDQVIESLGNAESVLLFGPGEAKGELKKRLEKLAPHKHLLVVETADKMTDRQITTKVRAYFHSKKGSLQRRGTPRNSTFTALAEKVSRSEP